MSAFAIYLDLDLEGVAQHLTRSPIPASHCAHRKAEEFCDLGHRETVPVNEPDDLCQIRAEPGHRITNIRALVGAR